MANKSSLSKMTKVQLIEHSEELEEKLSQRKLDEYNETPLSESQVSCLDSILKLSEILYNKYHQDTSVPSEIQDFLYELQTIDSENEDSIDTWIQKINNMPSIF